MNFFSRPIENLLISLNLIIHGPFRNMIKDIVYSLYYFPSDLFRILTLQGNYFKI